MPGGRAERDDRRDDQVDEVDRLRATLASGFAYVRSRDVTSSVAAVTFEESLEQAISDIEVDESDIRPSRLTMIRSLRDSVVAAVESARRLPPGAFDTQRGQGEANTTIDGDGPVGEVATGETDS